MMDPECNTPVPAQHRFNLKSQITEKLPGHLTVIPLKVADISRQGDARNKA